MAISWLHNYMHLASCNLYWIRQSTKLKKKKNSPKFPTIQNYGLRTVKICMSPPPWTFLLRAGWCEAPPSTATWAAPAPLTGDIKLADMLRSPWSEGLPPTCTLRRNTVSRSTLVRCSSGREASTRERDWRTRSRYLIWSRNSTLRNSFTAWSREKGRLEKCTHLLLKIILFEEVSHLYMYRWVMFREC